MAKVLIKEFGTNEAVKTIECEANQAETVEGGVNRNLNHEKYYTEIEE